MTAVLAGVAGAGAVGGVLLIAAGLLRVEPAPSRHRPRVRRSVHGRWARWRWVAAAAAGLLGFAVTGWPVVGLIVAAAVVGLPFLLGSEKSAARAIDRVQAIEEWTRRLAD